MSEKIDHRRDTVSMKQNTPLATFIREWCKQAGTTQTKLSEMVGIDRSMVSRMALGTRIPNRDVAMRMAEAMDIPDATMALMVFGIDPQRVARNIREEAAMDALAAIRKEFFEGE